MQKGYTTLGNIAGNSKKETTITFPESFGQSTPIVAITIEHSGGWSDAITYCIVSVSANNVKVSVNNKASAAMSVVIHWIAMI